MHGGRARPASAGRWPITVQTDVRAWDERERAARAPVALMIRAIRTPVAVAAALTLVLPVVAADDNFIGIAPANGTFSVTAMDATAKSQEAFGHTWWLVYDKVALPALKCRGMQAIRYYLVDAASGREHTPHSRDFPEAGPNKIGVRWDGPTHDFLDRAAAAAAAKRPPGLATIELHVKVICVDEKPQRAADALVTAVRVGV